jgi:sugar/nucleoside kinase (ribokinase family)
MCSLINHRNSQVSFKAYDIIGIGVSTLDLLTVVGEFPAVEGVQKAHESSLQGGGPVATAIVAAAKLGAKTAMIDSLGDDWRGDLIIREFENFGVDTQFITVGDDKTSSIASIHVRKNDGKRTIIFSPGNASEVTVASLPVQAIVQAKVVHMNGRHITACREVCRIAKANGVKISFDGGAGRYRSELDEILPLADYCIIAKEFCDQWLGRMNVNDALRKIIANGSSLAVITMGEKGSVALDGTGEIMQQQAYKIDNIVDTTGCGDIYHGALLYALVKEIPLKDALKIASAAAALKAEHLGGRGLVPDIQQVMAFISRY